MTSRFPRLSSGLLIAVLAACGGGSSDGPGETSVASAAPPAAAPTPATPVPVTPGSVTPGPVTPSAADAAFGLALDADKAIVFQGGSAVVGVRVSRQPGFTQAVSIQVSGLPAGVGASPAILAADASSATVTLTAAADAPHSLPTRVGVEGRALVDASAPRSVAALTVTVRGAPGTVDTSFAGGAFLTRVGTSEDYAQAVAVQPDGKVLVAGSSASNAGVRMAVVRHLRDGGIDTSFGTDGRVVVAVGTRDDKAMAIAVQPDGKIVLAGLTHRGAAAGYDFALVRLLDTGALDTGFGDAGRVVTDFGGDNDRAFALLAMPDGRLVAGGQTNRTGGTGLDFALARYLPDGRPDPAFGNGGQVVAAILPSSTGDVIRALALQPVNGQPHLLAVGGEGDFTVARFTPAGALDTGFGADGRVTGLFGASIGSATAVTVLPGGEAVIAGHVGHDFAAVKLGVDGRLDAGFGPARDGRFRHAVAPDNWDEATALARQADGKFVLGGWAFAGIGTSGDFAALRLTADGTLDTGFGTGGTLRAAVAEGTRTDLGRALALQADERVPAVRAILAGEAQGTDRDFALARLWL